MSAKLGLPPRGLSAQDQYVLSQPYSGQSVEPDYGRQGLQNVSPAAELVGFGLGKVGFGLGKGAANAARQHVLSNQLKKLKGADLYHGGYGWQSKSKGLWTTPSVRLAQSYKNRRAESLSSRSFEATTPPAVWKAGTDTLEKVVVLDKPTKVFIAEVKNEIKRLESQVAKNPAHETIDLTIEIRGLKQYLKNPKKMGNTHNIGYDAHIYDNALRRVLTKNNYDGVVNSKHLKTIVTGGKDNAQFVFLRRPDLNKIPKPKK